MLTVSDNGCGFDPASVGRGIGLVSIFERARLAGGQGVVRSQLSVGTEVEVFVLVTGDTHEQA